MPAAKDLTDIRFDKTTAIRDVGKASGGRGRLWECRCDCGRTHIVVAGHLLSGHTRSCGCLWEEAGKCTKPKHITHGYTSRKKNGQVSSEYSIWSGMKARCNNPTNASYLKYGAKGIRVCGRWDSGEGDLSGFECFIADMGDRPTRGHSLDRIDSSKDYSPDNCKWSTHKEQQNNRCNNIMIRAFGEFDTVANWADRKGIKRTVILNRIAAGWEPEKAMTHPVRQMKRLDYSNA